MSEIQSFLSKQTRQLQIMKLLKKEFQLKSLIEELKHYLQESQLQSSLKRKKMFKNSKTLLQKLQAHQVPLHLKQDKLLLKLQESKKLQLNQRPNKLKQLHNNQLLQAKECLQAQLQKLLLKKKELICLKFKVQVQMEEF